MSNARSYTDIRRGPLRAGSVMQGGGGTAWVDPGNVSTLGAVSTYTSGGAGNSQTMALSLGISSPDVQGLRLVCDVDFPVASASNYHTINFAAADSGKVLGSFVGFDSRDFGVGRHRLVLGNSPSDWGLSSFGTWFSDMSLYVYALRLGLGSQVLTLHDLTVEVVSPVLRGRNIRSRWQR